MIDEDPALRTYLRRRLTETGYRVREVAPGPTTFDDIAACPADLVILSLDAAECDPSPILCVREISAVPIVAVSVRDDEDIIVQALTSGADDYIKKPFGIRELLARIQSTLRRTARERGEPPLFVLGDLVVDLSHRRVLSQGRDVHLSVKPYEVLRVLVQSAGKVLTHAELMMAVWGDERRQTLGYLRLAIRELRRRIEADPNRPKHIVTEPRVGYRLVTPSRALRNRARSGRAAGKLRA